MKKIIGLTLAALLILGMVTTGTLAYFSDTETSTGNVFTAGTLDLGLFNSTNASSTGSVTGTFSASTLKPGDITSSATLYINNEGNLAMNTVTVSITGVTVTDHSPTTVDNYNATADTDKLEKMIKVKTATFDGTTVGASLVGQSLFTLNTAGAITLPKSLPAGTEYALVMTFEFDSTATNGCQGDEITFTLNVNGTQQ